MLSNFWNTRILLLLVKVFASQTDFLNYRQAVFIIRAVTSVQSFSNASQTYRYNNTGTIPVSTVIFMRVYHDRLSLRAIGTVVRLPPDYRGEADESNNVMYR